MRIALQEGGQRRRDDQSADPPRDVDPQQAARPGDGFAEQPLDILDLGDHPQAAFVKHDPVLRGGDAPRRPVEQPRAEPCLQFLDRGGNRGARHPEQIRRAGETRAFDDAREDAEQVDAIHRNSLLFVRHDM